MVMVMISFVLTWWIINEFENVVSNKSDSLYHLIPHNETKGLFICGTRDPLGQVLVKPTEQEILLLLQMRYHF